MTRYRLPGAWLFAAALAAAPALRAELIAADDFEGYAAGSIHGNSGGSGWSGAWQGDGPAVESIIDTSAAELVYRTPGGERVVGSDRALAFTGNDDFAALRNIADPQRHRDVYVSMLVRFSGTQNHNDLLTLWFGQAGFGAAPNIGVKMNDGTGSTPEDFFARTQASNHVSLVDIVEGRTYFVVGHLSKPNNGVNTVFNQFRIWVDPVSLTTQPPADAVSSGNSSITGFARIGFRSANLDTNDSVVVDRLRIGTTWQDVTEPDRLPVLELRMDEASWNGSNGEVTDYASGFDATAFGGATTANVTPAVPGSVGTCRYGSFDGSSDYLLVPHAAELNGTDSLTYMAWIRPESWSGVRQVMAKSVHGGGSGRAQMGLFSEGNVFKLRAETGRGRLEATTALPAVATWTHVAGVFSGRRLELYLNGALAGVATFAATTLVATTDPLAVSRRVGSSEYFFDGAIDEVRVYREALEAAAIQAAMNTTRPCELGPFIEASAFRLDHDGAGIHCLDEPVQVSVLDATGNLLTDYAGEVVLSTGSGRGSWALRSGAGLVSDAVADDGEARYRFAAADGGVAIFALSYPQGSTPLDVDVYEVADPAVRDTDTEGVLEFAPSGFTVTAHALSNPPPGLIHDPIPTQLAGAPFEVHVTAYGVTPDDPLCGVIESYDGTPSLSFSQTLVNPASGPLTATVAGVAANGMASAAVPFTAGRALVPARYKDVGAMRLNIRDSTSFDHVLNGATNTFVVQPAALVVTRIQSAAGVDNPGADSATGPAFVAAGDSFLVDVEARDADGDRTPSYGRETPAEGVRVASDALLMPAGGRNGSTGDVLHGAAFSATATAGRFSNDVVAFDEVGAIRLRPAVADGDYLGSGSVHGELTGPVGRFHPAAFQVLGDAVGAACGTFTYMDQPALSLQFVLQALAMGGSVTENYDFALLADPAALAGIGLRAEAGDDGIDRGPRLSALTTPWLAGEVTVDVSDLTFARQAAPDGPFDALQLSLRVQDELDGRPLLALNGNPTTSGDCVAAGDCTDRALGTVTRLVYGRLALLPAAGPENEALNVPLVVQAYTGAAFESHPADHCTTYSAGQVTLSNHTGNLAAGTTSLVSPAGTATLVGGVADGANPLTLSPPGFGREGTVDVTLDVPPWLEFDWHGTGLADPTATAAFGRYRGHDRIIYWGEQR